MPRRAILLGVLALTAAGCGSGIMKHVPFMGSIERYLPEGGAVPGLTRTSKLRGYRGDEMEVALGKSAVLYRNYGATGMSTADYVLGRDDRSLTIQSFSMADDVAAAGLFHYFRGRKLGGSVERVDAGAEGIVDVRHERRNLYFYKQRYFFKIIYTGTAPVPDLAPLARAIAARVPGRSERPAGLVYLEVEGVDTDSAQVTPGYTFNCDFLPPGVIAKAPGAGSAVAEVFLIGHNDKKEATRTGRDYRTYLQLNGKDYDSHQKAWRGRPIWTARDPSQGRVICTVYKEYVIGVVRPKDYALGEAIINRIIRKMGGEP